MRKVTKAVETRCPECQAVGKTTVKTDSIKHKAGCLFRKGGK